MLNKLTFYSFFLLVFSLGFMSPYLRIERFAIPISDFIFVITFVFWVLALIFKKTQFHWHQFFWLLLFYFTAMLLSAVFSINPTSSFIKLLGEIYLLSLPVLTFNLIRDEKRLKQAVWAWLSASAISVLVGFLTIFLFYFDRENWLLSYTLFHYGTLPPGNYPRLQSTFLNANMLCNYFSVSLMLALISHKLGWINKKLCFVIFGGILLCSLFTFSPGLGGIALSIGIWLWLFLKNKRRVLALTSLFCGLILAVFFLFAVMIAPNLHPTAPFHIDIPIIETRIEPSSRTMAWIDSWKTFTENPVFGRGIGQNACEIRYMDLSGRLQLLTDAHNTFLNVAAQTGVFGLLVIVVIIFYLSRKIFPLTFDNASENVLRIGFGLAFVSAFFYQGIGGSFEDARHLWILIGLILSLNHPKVES